MPRVSSDPALPVITEELKHLCKAGFYLRLPQKHSYSPPKKHISIPKFPELTGKTLTCCPGEV